MYKWTQKEKKQVTVIVEKALKELNMESWVITNFFKDGKITGENNGDGKYFVASAMNTVTYEYEKIDVSWMPAFLKDIRDLGMKDAKETIYHELIHGLTQELYELSLNRFATQRACTEAVERLTQRVTRIVCK